MPSSTSSSEFPMDRPLPSRSLALAAVIAVVITIAGLGIWEWQWRSFGATPSYKNSDGLWAIERRRIDNGEGDKTVLIGSSRMYFDFQLDVWERVTGERPIQLSLEGTSPMALLEQLAEDPDLTGPLLVGVTPMLFFNGFDYRGDVFEHYFTETPSQRLGQRISMLLEPWFAFYQTDFALFTVLERHAWPVRDGVRSRKDVRKLANFSRDRNARLWDKVENDPDYNALVKQIWSQNIMPPDKRPPGFIDGQLSRRKVQLERAVNAVKKLHERGITVIFVRPPSEGPFAQSEMDYQPRADTWDVLLERTGAPGIHFADYPSLQNLRLAEWSHLIGEDADRFTEALAVIVQDQLKNQSDTKQ